MNALVKSILFISILFILNSCSNKETNIKIGLVSTDVTSINPFLKSNSRMPIVLAMIYDCLFYSTENGEIFNRIADDAYSENNKVIIKVKPDILFHDGSQLFSHDFVNTFNLAKEFPYNKNYHALSDYVSSVTEIDELTMQIEFYENVPKDISILAQLPIVKYSEIVDEFVGAGPYQLYSLKPRSIILNKYDKYYQPHTGPDSIEFILYNDTSELLKALVLKEVDFMSSLHFSNEDIKMIMDTEDYQLFPYIPPFCIMIVFNNTHPYFKSNLTRKAISLAIDREYIVKNILNNKGIPAYTPFHLSASEPHEQDSYFNPDQSKELLLKAGWILDQESQKYYNQEDQPFSFQLLCEEESDFMKNTSTYLRQHLKSIGIEMNVQYHSRNIIEASFFTGDYEAAFLGLRSDSDTKALYQFWHSNSIENGLNILRYRNSEVDRLIEKLTIELPIDERLPIYGQLKQAFSDDPPAVFLFSREQYLILSKQFSATFPHPQLWYYLMHQWNIRRN